MKFENLVGKTLVNVSKIKDGEELVFVADDGSEYKLWHCQDCCEYVRIEDICGDLKDLVGSKILHASEDSSSHERDSCDCLTWTFYNIGTFKGHVTVRWIGESNGYYSESVDFKQTKEANG